MPAKVLDIDRLKHWLDYYSDRRDWNETSQIDLLLAYVAYNSREASVQDFRCFLAGYARAEEHG